MSLSTTNLCRLCLNLCGKDSRSLYNETGESNEIYEISVKFFHPMFLNVVPGNYRTVICSQCWHHISNFNAFQQTVFEAQGKLLIDESDNELQLEKCSGNTNGDNGVIKYDEDDSISLPDLELMEDVSYDYNTQYSSQDLEVSLNNDLTTENNNKQIIKITNSTTAYPYAAGKSDSSEKENKHQTKIQYKCSSRTKPLELDRRIAQWKPSLKCEICCESLASFTLMQQHFRRLHPGEQCYITCCNRIFKIRSKIEEHARFHIDASVYSCHVCGARHSSKLSLYMHNRTHHSSAKGSKAVKSNNCQKQKKRRTCGARKGNKKTPSEQIDAFISKFMPNINCVVCDETLSTFTLLKSHFAQQHPDGEFYVLCCQRRFVSRSSFREHVQLHLDPEAFQCKDCGKNNSNYNNLRTHVARMHSADFQNNRTRPKRIFYKKSIKAYDDMIARWQPSLECVICHTSFSTFSNLHHHFRLDHSKDDFYILCCQKKFNTRPAILHHMQKHRKPNDFKCPLCEKRYSYEKSYQEHMRNLHPEYRNAISESMAKND